MRPDRPGDGPHHVAALQQRRARVKRELWSLCRGDARFRWATDVLRSIDGLSPADWLPPASHTGFGASVHGQQRRPGAVGDPQLVPAEVDDVVEHIRAALRLEHPMDEDGGWYAPGSAYEARKEAELQSAVRRAVEEGDAAALRLQDRLAVMRALSRLLEPLSAHLRARFAPQHILSAPCQNAHVALFAALIEAMPEVADEDLPIRLVLGAPVAGVLPATHAWDEQEPARPLGLDAHHLPHARWNAHLAADIERRARSPLAAQAVREVWEGTIEELDAGMCDGPYTAADMNAMFGREGWRACRRFSIWQNGKMRLCDNMAENLVNAGSTSVDKLRCQRPDLPARVAAMFAKRLPQERLLLGLGTDDQQKAYRRVLTEEPGLSAVAALDPDSGETRFFVLRGFNFGLLSAVLYFNAVGAVASSAARRFLAVITDNYFDDYLTVALGLAGEGPQNALGEFMALLGFPFSDEKHVPWAAANPFLGVVSDFRRLPTEGIVAMHLSDSRREKIRVACSEARAGLSPHQAARLAGKLWWASTWVLGSVGRAAIQPISVRAQSDDEGLTEATPAIRRALAFCEQVVTVAPPRIIEVVGPRRGLALIWSDARYAASAPVPASGGFVVLLLDAHRSLQRVVVGSGANSSEFVRQFVSGRRTYIGQLEIAWAVSPYMSIPDLLAGRRVIHFIDNTSALAALVKGYASAIDSGLLVNAFHAFNAGLGAHAYFEYVRSKANVADYPSRFEFALLVLALDQAGLSGIPWSTVIARLPSVKDWSDYSPQAWLEEGLELASA
jgi:hypothetical protein